MNSYLTTILCGACLFVIVLRLLRLWFTMKFASHRRVFSFFFVSEQLFLSLFLTLSSSISVVWVLSGLFCLFFLCMLLIHSAQHCLQSAQKRNFLEKCQLCTLNIYRIAIYVIAWFSRRTNMRSLSQKTLWKLSYFRSNFSFSHFMHHSQLLFFYIFVSLFFVIKLKEEKKTLPMIWSCVCIHNLVLCTASIGIFIYFWLLLLLILFYIPNQLIVRFWHGILFAFYSSQISIICLCCLSNLPKSIVDTRNYCKNEQVFGYCFAYHFFTLYLKLIDWVAWWRTL